MQARRARRRNAGGRARLALQRTAFGLAIGLAPAWMLGVTAMPGAYAQPQVYGYGADLGAQVLDRTAADQERAAVRPPRAAAGLVELLLERAL